MKFDARRFDEFETFCNLLEEVKSLNRGSGFLERIARCIERAEQLTATEWETLRQSFRQWLHDELCRQHEQFIQAQAEENNDYRAWRYPSRGELPNEDKRYEVSFIGFDGNARTGQDYWTGAWCEFPSVYAFRELPEPAPVIETEDGR